jgi:hypothetical protein
MDNTVAAKRAGFPAPQALVGLLLLLVCWPLNWGLSDRSMRTAYLFFPLWLGYILVVDGFVLIRTGSSLWTRSRRDFVLLFVASAPAWWLFELINQRTANWQYRGSETFTEFQYILLCTVCFSTVMPAVFETAELLRSFRWMGHFASGARLRPAPGRSLVLFVGGGLLLALTLTWPRHCYPFVWCSLVLLLEPMNYWLGRPSLMRDLERGDWRPLIALGLGALTCGFFWEMWNYYSYPRWVYSTPGAQFLHVFEMPLLGYGGYLPFGLELYALKNLLWGRAVSLRL